MNPHLPTRAPSSCQPHLSAAIMPPRKNKLSCHDHQMREHKKGTLAFAGVLATPSGAPQYDLSADMGGNQPVTRSPCSMKIHGQCECGRCSYEVDDDTQIDIANCHCVTCRRTTGGTYVTWATVPKKRFRWTGKRPRIYRSSKHGKRYFCSTCGAQLALWTSESPETIDLTVSTFSNANRYPPTRHIWVQSRLKWLCLRDELAQEQREEIEMANKRLQTNRHPALAR